jgi:hypothetical protein
MILGTSVLTFGIRKVHFIGGDADSLNYAISGDPEKERHQGFEHMIKNEVFYKEKVYKRFPNPQLGTKDKMKLLRVSFEKEGYVMYTIAPKCYILKGNNSTFTYSKYQQKCLSPSPSSI